MRVEHRVLVWVLVLLNLGLGVNLVTRAAVLPAEAQEPPTIVDPPFTQITTTSQPAPTTTPTTTTRPAPGPGPTTTTRPQPKPPQTTQRHLPPPSTRERDNGNDWDRVDDPG